MSDRGPADEEQGDVAKTSSDAAHLKIQLGNLATPDWSQRSPLTTSTPYRFRGARSRQCCRLEWFSHSGPRAGSEARCEDQMTTCCSEFPTPPSRCHNSCAEKHPAGPARGWRWRRSRADGGAANRETTNEHL